jgi:hypothetical protein
MMLPKEDVVEAERTRPVSEKPRINAAAMKFVTTGEPSDVLLQFESIQADRTNSLNTVSQIRQGLFVSQAFGFHCGYGQLDQFIQGARAVAVTTLSDAESSFQLDENNNCSNGKCNNQSKK